jgi:hypothetical protein
MAQRYASTIAAQPHQTFGYLLLRLREEDVSRAFFGLSGERLLSLKSFIARFIATKCFENETNRVLHALEESNVELPEIICRAAERILEFLGKEGTHIAYHGSMIALLNAHRASV